MTEYDRRDETMNLICDECTSNEHFDGSWQECINAAKLAKWLIQKISETWLHFCSPACSERWKKKNMNRMLT